MSRVKPSVNDPIVFRHALAGVALCLFILAELPADDVVPQEVNKVKFFEEQVRPILVERCQKCHGPVKQEGGLRLDSRDALLKGGENGPAITPGTVNQSLLLSAVRRTGDLEMPPDRPLSEPQIAALTRWVEQGAVWPGTAVTQGSATSPEAFAKARREHWALQPIRRPEPPQVRDGSWSINRVDQFILAKLESAGLKPSLPADKKTLLRRVTFDLTGLPPTFAETQVFDADSNPDAYSRLVDRLLASPRYGERWGRHWLDVARYSDTKGYVFFEDGGFPWAWTYRDYVLEAFNSDLPYDRFICEQLAADRMPLGENHRPLRALGFLTLGGRFMNNPHDIIDDRIDVVSRGLLGLTTTCARCHDHKFDPIPTADYYSLYGVFASTFEPIVPALYDPPPATEEYRKFEAELRSREAKLLKFVQDKQGEVVNGARNRVAEYLLAVHAMKGQPKTDDFMLLADSGDLNPKMLRRWQIYLEQLSKTHHRVLAAWQACIHLGEGDFANQASVAIQKLVSETDPRKSLNPIVAQSLQAKPPQKLADVAERYGELIKSIDLEWQALVQAAVIAKQPLPVALLDASREEIRQVVYGPDAPTNVPVSAIGDLDLLPDRASQGTLRELRKAIESFRSAGPAAPPRAMNLEDIPSPVEPRIFRRGNPNQQGEPVHRHFLQVLAGDAPKPFTNGSGRLELAEAIIHPDNPLTARVFVNRVWLQHFGAGLVRTPSDFGLRSDRPSHPELLDELASQFIAHGWSVKNLHRQILLSATYQQASGDRPEGLAADPENRLLWKMNRRRLDLEALRDSFLAVSGKMDTAVGGASINMLATPAIPRRTVYASIDRLALPSLLRTFDFPSPDTTNPQRDNTTVAPQALFLMNHPFPLEMAQQLINRQELKSAPDFANRLDRLYEIVFGRPATADERNLATEFFQSSNLEPQESPEKWTLFAHSLLLTNEFAFVE
ncbi:MAG: Planctomycete cytochrome [Planctomycetaceae bacterium]|nr:Planctomycete cytochrome [Planctomycetaceae bacterium]